MESSAEPALAHATSRDGTRIGYRTSGDGPPLLLVHGTSGDGTRFGPLLPYLQPHFTVHAIDRRGRGTSGDATDYDVSHEFEDVAAVVDDIAAGSEGPVNVYGHSFGAVCALGAATSSTNIQRMVLYEPPLRAGEGDGTSELVEDLDALLAADRREEVVETFFREVVRAPDEAIRAFKESASWDGRVAAAHTIVREFKLDLAKAFPLDRAASIHVPVLLLTGELSPEWLIAASAAAMTALPDARVASLSGLDHVGDLVAPELVADHIVAFLLPTEH